MPCPSMPGNTVTYETAWHRATAQRMAGQWISADWTHGSHQEPKLLSTGGYLLSLKYTGRPPKCTPSLTADGSTDDCPSDLTDWN